MWQRATSRTPQPGGIPPGWRNVGPADQPRIYVLHGRRHEVRVTGRAADPLVVLDDRVVSLEDVSIEASTLTARIDGRHLRCELALGEGRVYVDGTLGGIALEVVERLEAPGADEAPGSMHAPLPGAVRNVAVSKGAQVKAGDVLMIPPGHDAWVEGNEPVVVIDFQGFADYAKKK